MNFRLLCMAWQFMIFWSHYNLYQACNLTSALCVDFITKCARIFTWITPIIAIDILYFCLCHSLFWRKKLLYILLFSLPIVVLTAKDSCKCIDNNAEDRLGHLFPLFKKSGLICRFTKKISTQKGNMLKVWDEKKLV